MPSLTRFNESFTLFLMIICIGVMPLVFIYLIINHINIYQKHKFNTRYGSLFEDVDLRTKWQAAFYFVYCLRRIVFILVVFTMGHISGIQLLFINLMNLAILVYTGYNYPLKTKFANRLEMFNELFVCFITLHMYFFTDWVLDKNNQTDKDVQYNYGIMMNYFLSYYIYCNIWIILWHNIRTYCLIVLKYSRLFRYTFCEWGVEIPELKHHHKDALDSIMRINDHLYNFKQKKLIEPHFNELP